MLVFGSLGGPLGLLRALCSVVLVVTSENEWKVRDKSLALAAFVKCSKMPFLGGVGVWELTVARGSLWEPFFGKLRQTIGEVSGKFLGKLGAESLKLVLRQTTSY